MGVGHFVLRHTNTVHIEYPYDANWEEWELHDESVFMYEGAKAAVLRHLPKSFTATNEQLKTGEVIAENAFYKVLFTNWCHYLAISVQVKDAHWSQPWEFNPLALYHHASTSKKLFDKLSHEFEVRVATSAWTSGVYLREAA
ncbi:hypothetical protein ACROAH_15110 [Shewanella oncorhynchi]|uniref:hypothetical protein n=1 Tax=Shewanella TaxID=22 RepID=UPI0039AEEB9C